MSSPLPASSTSGYPVDRLRSSPPVWTAADDEVPEPPSATGQYPDPVWAEATAEDDEVPAPPSATGQYPDPVWAEATAEDDEVPEPPSATGQYPDPVWAEATATGNDDEDAPEPPSATGQYPDPVWATTTEEITAAAAADIEPSSPPAPSAPPSTPIPSPSLSLKEPDYSDELGDALDPVHVSMVSPVPLSKQLIYRIIREVAVADSGDELYAAISADREYQTPGQAAYQQRRFGLAFGLVLFTQESGRLGSVLRLMQQRDGQRFQEIFGPAADELLLVTNSAQVEDRLAPVGGQPLSSPAWVERFRRAGAIEAFQAAQNEEAIEGQFRPMLKLALALGLSTDRALAMVYDRVVTAGLGTGLRWIVEAVGPLRTEAQRSHALQLLGFNLAGFQATVPWLPKDGRFGPATHAALVGALRASGLVPLPTPLQMLSQLVHEAGGPARQRLLRLRDSKVFADIVHGPAGPEPEEQAV